MSKISLSGPDITQAEINAVYQVMQNGRLSLGPELEAFEKSMASYVGTKEAVAVSSGTAGLHCIIKALDIREGDEVITSPFSFIASANSILFERALPVFVDIDPETYSMNPDLIEAKITSKTKAILAVHLIGVSCQMDKIQAIAKKHNLMIIEDACEAIGGQWKGRMLGSIGRAGVFAFYPNKQMTTGEGGIIVTNDTELARTCRSLRNQGRSAHDGYVFERLGYNYRMSDIQAVLGRIQLSRLPEMLLKRRQVAEWYQKELKDFSEIILPPGLGDSNTSWFIFLIRLADRFDRASRDQLRKDLFTEGIETGAYFPTIHLQQFYRDQFGYKPGDFPITEFCSDRTLALPFYNQLTKEDVHKISKTLLHLLALVSVA